MKSPFPGLDPYLEQRWPAVHQALTVYAHDALQLQLPDDLRARMDERLYLEMEPDPRRFIMPDIHVVSRPDWQLPTSERPAAGGVAMVGPQVFEVPLDMVTEGFIEIRERGGGMVITVIEFLSPGNKCGGVGQEKYEQKRDEVLESDASLVEIDLVRAGRRVMALSHFDIPLKNRGDALVCIRPGYRRSRRELYAMPLRERLPAIPIPLRKDEPRILLDLQNHLDRVYSAGRYDDTDYRAPLDPPLSADDAAWADELLKAAGLRSS